MKFKILILFLLAFAFASLPSKAQMSFPNGKSIDLVTDNDFLYMETRLIFNIGKRKAEQYRWEKISDSVDSDWLLGSCFNGVCLNGLPDSGNFYSGYSIADSLCFIAFHVETYGHNGKSVIKYRVTNRYDPTETADLTISVTYDNPAGISSVVYDASSNIAVYPNPAKGLTHIRVPRSCLYFASRRLEIFSASGRMVLSKELDGRSEVYTLNLKELQQGIYTVKIPTQGGYVYKKIMVR